MKKLSSIIAVVLFLSLFLVGGAFAVPVQYTGVGPGSAITIGGTWHSGSVYAGIYNLLVNGVATDSFCIDLSDNSTTAAVDYNVVALKDAADPAFGPMGATAAHDVSVLWALGYAAATTSNEAAVSLQVAIWEVVADVNDEYGYDLSQGAFIATDNGAQALLAGIANFKGTPANLVGLTNNTYQDYVTQQVPEPFSMLLLGLGLLGVAGVRRVSKK